MPRSLMTAKWWRFSDYEIFRDKRQIAYLKPASGAKLTEYDLWTRWEKARPIRQDRPTPYQELLDLLHRIGLVDPLSHPPGDQKVVAELADRYREPILDWCRSYGLLGVFPHQVFFIAFEPREKSGVEASDFWARLPPDVKNGAAAPSHLVTQLLYSRTAAPPGHWERAELLINGDAFPSGVLLKTFTSTFLPATFEHVAHFFPELPRSTDSGGRLIFECPRPLSDDFWYAYAEPVHSFLWVALALYRAVAAMRVKKYTLGTDKFFQVATGVETFSGLLAPVKPAPEWQQGRGVRQRWSSSSLIGALAMMALADLPEGPARVCKGCRKLFVSSGRPWGIYCSKQCRWRDEKRKQRRG